MIGKSSIDLAQLNIFKSPFTCLQYIRPKKSCWLTQLYLIYDLWFMNPEIWLADNIFLLAQLKIYKPPLTFLEPISACHRSSWFINFYLKYNWFKNFAIWLVKDILLKPTKHFKTTFHLEHGKDWPSYS